MATCQFAGVNPALQALDPAVLAYLSFQAVEAVIARAARMELLEALGTIIHDPVLRERFRSELELLTAGHVPEAPHHDNVVELFSAGRVSS